MENPISEIPAAIDECAGAADPDSQIDAFHKYFTPDASFVHPLCYVPSRAESRSRVIGIYLFYRIAIPLTYFHIKSVAFDEDKGKLYVDLDQMPWLRGISWVLMGWRPTIPMHVHFWVRKAVDNKYYIYKQEDTIQALDVMLAIPPLMPFALGFFLLCEFFGLVNAYIFTWLGFWRPTKHLQQHIYKKQG